MHKKAIITISRQFGSKGREVGKKLAERLQIPFYDRDLIELAAKESGIDPELFQEDAVKKSKGFHFLGTLSYSLGGPIPALTELSIHDRIFLVQAQVIESLAMQGPCVLIGRCADYVLNDREDVVNVYIHANIVDRCAYAVNTYGMDAKSVEESIHKIDKHRKNYYEYYSNRIWGQAENYDICINTSTFTIEEAVDLLERFVKE